ncbi:cell wall elongation regulator TseB-like domain-containing protein [Lapidilactobacillus bayanensis]|uniref:cell wall elongation regulator TseB-like domain-containing protein n=1 Tax=Lapidilactobacillus bayanensis TaxID=2485998 RepID=UPI000F771DBB|nr:DUF5590 domain-containing protein [Lapidilactobacillus bayanensis]
MHKRNIVLGIVVILVLLVFSGYKIATTPRNTLEKQSITISKKAAHLTTTTDFMIYHRAQTYYSVAGYTQDNQLKYVVINGKSGKIKVLSTKKAYTKAKITKLVTKKYHFAKIYGIDLGLRQGQPVWEVATKTAAGKLDYRLLDYYTGKTIEQIENL